MAQGQGRSSGQGVKMMYIRDYLCSQTSVEAGKGVSAKDISAFLASKGIKASVKTIYNDILRLQIDFDLPVEYDPHKHRYFITKPLFEPYELRLMVDGIQSSKFITQERAREITANIAGLADVYTRAALNRQSYVTNRVRNMNDSVVKDADRIHQAIAEDSKIGFRYFHYSPNKDNPKKYSKNGTQYIVSPFALLWNNGNYYLYAYLSDKQEFRYFRVDRMERISLPLGEKRDGREAFKSKNITAQKAKVFDMYNGREFTVRMRFINRLADAVIDQFGKDVMMIPDDKNHFIVSVPVEISPPFFAWVATFGRAAKILSPEPVVDEMKKFIERVADMYKEEGKM